MCLVLFVFAARPAAALEELLLGVNLNEVDHGTIFATRTPDGDFLIAEKNLQAMGFRPLPGPPFEIGGEPHFSLRALPGVTFSFDPDAVLLRITAPPGLLARTTIDFLDIVRKDVEYPVGRSAFLNLGLDYRDGEGSDPAYLQAAQELGLRWEDYLLLSDGIYRSGGASEGFVRLMSRASWEDRDQRVRLTLGDFSVPARDLWAAPDLGGISFTKLYRMDPYRLRNPTYGLAGQTAAPAQVRVYLDGALIREEKVPPGEFEVTSLDAYGGDRRVAVVVRDVFGRETRIEGPFYFTNAVLGHGLHEYSYNLGAVREEFGVESNRYGSLALSAFHRYGVNDRLTVGLGGQAGEGVYSAGPTLAFVAGTWGVISLALSAGRMDGEGGYAGVAAYDYESSHFSARARFQYYSPSYRTLLEANDSLAGLQSDAAVSYGTSTLGRLSLSWASRNLEDGEARTRYGAEYNLSLFGAASLQTSAARVEEGDDRWTEFYAGVTFYPDEKQTLTSQYSRRQDGGQTTVEYASDRTNEEGLAWKGTAQWQEDLLTVRPWAEYRGQRGVLSGDVVLREEDGQGYRSAWGLAAAASLYAAGGTYGIGRPVSDSFAVVKVGKDEGVPGVRVYQGGEEVGATGEDGTLFVPEVGSYNHNQISIEPRDVPLDYSIEELMHVVSPAERSGSVVTFEATRYQAVTGRLSVTIDGIRRPIEFVELVVRAGQRTWNVPSGKDGEFFLENPGTGRVALTFLHRGEERSCVVDIPVAEEVIVDLGEVPCAIAP